MKKAILTTILAVAGAMDGRASILVIAPNSNTATNANSGLLQSGARTYQIVYAASQFASVPLGYEIDAMSFRLADGQATWPSSSRTWTNYDVQISQSNFAPLSLSNTFADNIGADVVTVRSGALVVAPNSLSGGAGPNPFDFLIPFSTPYVYTGGDLLLTIRHTGNGVDSESFASHLIDANGQVIGASGYSATVNGGIAGSYPIAQFTFNQVPEPGSAYLLALGGMLFALVNLLQRRRQER